MANDNAIDSRQLDGLQLKQIHLQTQPRNIQEPPQDLPAPDFTKLLTHH